MCFRRRRKVRPAARPVSVDELGWASVSGLSQREAEDLLDWLEANRFAQREVVYTSESEITVRWRR